MAYFSNGEEGRQYQAQYCDNCAYWAPDTMGIGSDAGCPIWFLHELHVGDKSDDGSYPDWHFVLDHLIPMKDGYPDQCYTYLPKHSRKP